MLGGEGPSVVADTRDRPDLIFPTLRDGSTPRSAAISPIRLGERVLGVVEAYSTEPNHFSEDDTALLAAFADQAATAIETARLFGQARELALLQERDRIAKELHDGIIQTIYAVGLNLDYCRLTLRESPDDVEARLGDATGGLNRAISDIRNYIMDLTHRVGEVVVLARSGRGAGPRVRWSYDAGTRARRDQRRHRRRGVHGRGTRTAGRARPGAARGARERRSARSRGDCHGDRANRARADAASCGGQRCRLRRERLARPKRITVSGTWRTGPRMLDGHFDLQSAPGRGTTITFDVPLVS